MDMAGIRKSGDQELGYQVNSISGLNFEIMSVYLWQSYSCSLVVKVKLKKQSQFARIAYCVMRIALMELKKQSQFSGKG
jgi:hypothetical protein